MGSYQWTPEDDIRLRRIYASSSEEKTAVLFHLKIHELYSDGRSYRSIVHRCSQLGLKPKVLKKSKKCLDCGSDSELGEYCAKHYKSRWYKENYA